MVADQMAFVPALRITRMFGGYGVFREDRMFALIAQDRLYFKVDARSRPLFEAKGLGPFSYAARGRTHALGYFEAPPEVFEEVDAMRQWAGEAWRAAVESKQPAKRPRGSVRTARAATANTKGRKP
jgi:DNA transformation protein